MLSSLQYYPFYLLEGATRLCRQSLLRLVAKIRSPSLNPKNLFLKRLTVAKS